jgi:hypothetical protein
VRRDWLVGLAAGVMVPFAIVEPWTRRTERADPAWAFPLEPLWPSPVRAALALALSGAGVAAAEWILRAEGSARGRRGAVVGAAAFLLSLMFVFGSHGGDGIGDLIGKSEALRDGGNLFTGGELLGYLVYDLLIQLWPGDGPSGAFAAARTIGLLGVLGCVALAGELARGVPERRAAVTVALMTSPFLLLLGPYPQSTSLMNALSPWFLAGGLAALAASGPARSRAAWGAGTLLGLAVGAHGSAWFLGLAAAALTGALLRPAPRDASRFALGFAIPAGLAFAVDASWHDRRASNWGFTELEPGTLLEHLGGPLGVLGGSEHFLRPWTEELTAWVLSAAPGLGLGLVAAVLWSLDGGWRDPVRRGAAGFVGAAAAGCAVLWGVWDLWFGYPSDWDITAILALSLQALTVLLVARLRSARLSAAGLGAVAGTSAYSLVSLGSLFVGS